MSKEKKIIGRECKFAQYVPHRFNDRDDAVFVKEIIHYDDQTRESVLRRYDNPKRKFWTVKPGFRKYKDKKEYEPLEHLQEFETNQRQMPLRIAKALNLSLNNLSMRRLSENPYLYGSDISITSLIKAGYQTRYPEAVSDSTVAVLDIETDVVEGTEDILSIGLTCGTLCYIVVTEAFLGRTTDPLQRLQKAFDSYLGEYKDQRKIVLEVEIVKTGGLAVKAVLNRAHRLQPDFIAVWNINFDLKRMFQQLEKENFDVADVFCDPSVPREYRVVKYHEGPQSRVTSSGRAMAFSPHERWHTFDCPSSFYWICAMSTYAAIRKASGNLPSYSLDSILHLELGERKLKFEVADHLKGIEWHQFMQSKYKIEYLVYNAFDCIGVELLDKKTADLRVTIGELTGFSDYRSFSSTPKQLADDLHFFLLNKGCVVGTTGAMETELDAKVISRDDWIITLATHLVENNGVCCIAEFPDLRTAIRYYVKDLDVKSAYPYGQLIANIAKETTLLELSSIEGVSELDRRIVGLNLTGGDTNAVEFMTRMHNAPPLSELLALFEAEHTH